MQTIKVYLQESGSVAELRKDFNLYRGSFQNTLLNVIMPRSLLVDEFLSDYPKVANSVAVSSKGLLPNGDEWNSRAFELNFVKNFTQDGNDFVLYERLLPRAFVMNAGQTTVSVTVQSLRTDLVPVLDEFGYETGDFQEQITIEQIATTQTVNLHVMDTGNPNEEVLEPYESARINAQLGRIQQDLELIYGYRERGGTVLRDPSPINLSTLQDRVNTNAGRLNDAEQRLDEVELQSNTNSQDIANIQTTMLTGLHYIGSLPDSQTMPSNTDLDNLVESAEGRPAENGDQILFTLLDDEDHPISSFIYTFSGTQGWTYKEIPPIANARNGGMGLIAGTFGIGSNFNVIVDVIDGTVRRLFIRRLDGTYQELNLIIENHATRIAHNESEIDGIKDGTIAVGNALRLGGKFENQLNVATAVSAMRDGISRIIHSTYAMLTDVYTREEANEIFASRMVGQDMFFGQNTLEDEIPTTPPNGIQATVNLSPGNPSDMMAFEREMLSGLSINNRNKFTSRFFLQSDTTLSQTITVEIYGKRIDDPDYKLLATATRHNVVLDANIIESIEIDGLMNGLVNNESFTLIAGDTLRAEIHFDNDPSNLSAPVVINLITNQQFGSLLNITEPAGHIIIRQESRREIQIASGDWGTPDPSGLYTILVPFLSHQTSGGLGLGAWFTEIGTGREIKLDITKSVGGDITLQSTFPFAGLLCIVGGVAGDTPFDYNLADNKPMIGGIVLAGNKPQSAFDLYTRGEVRQLIADATRSLADIIGWFSAALPTDTSFLETGHLVYLWNGTGTPPTAFPYTNVMQWDGTQFVPYQPPIGNIGEYSPAPFDVWINLNIPSGNPNSWAWMVTGWDMIDFNVDMSAYRTAEQQDLIDESKADLNDDNTFIGNNIWNGNETHNGNVVINGSLTVNNGIAMTDKNLSMGISSDPDNKLQAGTDGKLYVPPIAAEIPTGGVHKSVSNATYSGDNWAIEAKISENVSMVSFWGSIVQNAGGTSGQAFQVLTPAQFPLLSRFIGQVDQWGKGIDAGNWTTERGMPIRITAAQGLEIVTPPGVAVGTTFSWQFVLFLVDGVVITDLG